MPKVNSSTKIGLKQFLDACTNTELRQIQRMLKKAPYRTRINEQLELFK